MNIFTTTSLAFLLAFATSALAQPTAQGAMMCKCQCQTSLMGGNSIDVVFAAPGGNGPSCPSQNKIPCEGFGGAQSVLLNCSAFLWPALSGPIVKPAQSKASKAITNNR